MIALVTGGSGGLGSAVCEHLARDGHAVSIGCLTNFASAETLASNLEERGGRALALPFDVADPLAVANAIAALTAEFGGLDMLVLAAACNTDSLLADLSPDESAHLYAVNVGGMLNCVRSALPHLMLSARGRIVTFSSTVAHMASPGTVGYAATKGAVESLTRVLAVELGPKRITVNAVAPGFIDAGLGRDPVAASGDWIQRALPLRRAGVATDVAEAVSFLVSEKADYLTGVVLPVDGGLLAGSRVRGASGAARSGKAST